ncbi:serine-rich adhesin for platelets isoform X2 [Aplysia californica]|uniref:Serine-rich adhesin for platelets isoform X2 n=1 Tax=Aplysia californica TaxID=6500 RepID=A0ABM0ZZQ7_APLCA|nr:serine-rich adhesin for platelets isoform X2 [Aplysia californica]
MEAVFSSNLVQTLFDTCNSAAIKTLSGSEISKKQESHQTADLEERHPTTLDPASRTDHVLRELSNRRQSCFSDAPTPAGVTCADEESEYLDCVSVSSDSTSCTISGANNLAQIAPSRISNETVNVYKEHDRVVGRKNCIDFDPKILCHSPKALSENQDKSLLSSSGQSVNRLSPDQAVMRRHPSVIKGSNQQYVAMELVFSEIDNFTSFRKRHRSVLYRSEKKEKKTNIPKMVLATNMDGTKNNHSNSKPARLERNCGSQLCSVMTEKMLDSRSQRQQRNAVLKRIVRTKKYYNKTIGRNLTQQQLQRAVHRLSRRDKAVLFRYTRHEGQEIYGQNLDITDSSRLKAEVSRKHDVKQGPQTPAIEGEAVLAIVNKLATLCAKQVVPEVTFSCNQDNAFSVSTTLESTTLSLTSPTPSHRKYYETQPNIVAGKCARKSLDSQQILSRQQLRCSKRKAQTRSTGATKQREKALSHSPELDTNNTPQVKPSSFEKVVFTERTYSGVKLPEMDVKVEPNEESEISLYCEIEDMADCLGGLENDVSQMGNRLTPVLPGSSESNPSVTVYHSDNSDNDEGKLTSGNQISPEENSSEEDISETRFISPLSFTVAPALGRVSPITSLPYLKQHRTAVHTPRTQLSPCSRGRSSRQDARHLGTISKRHRKSPGSASGQSSSRQSLPRPSLTEKNSEQSSPADRKKASDSRSDKAELPRKSTQTEPELTKSSEKSVQMKSTPSHVSQQTAGTPVLKQNVDDTEPKQSAGSLVSKQSNELATPKENTTQELQKSNTRNQTPSQSVGSAGGQQKEGHQSSPTPDSVQRVSGQSMKSDRQMSAVPGSGTDEVHRKNQQNEALGANKTGVSTDTIVKKDSVVSQDKKETSVHEPPKRNSKDAAPKQSLHKDILQKLANSFSKRRSSQDRTSKSSVASGEVISDVGGQKPRQSVVTDSPKQNVSAQSSNKSITAQSQSSKKSIDALPSKQKVTAQSSKKSVDTQSSKKSIDAQISKQNDTAQSSKQNVTAQSSKKSIGAQSSKRSIDAQSSKQNVTAQSSKKSIDAQSSKQCDTAHSSKQNVTAQSSKKSIDAQSAQSITKSIDAQSAQSSKKSIDAQSLKQNVTAQSSKKSIDAQSSKKSVDAQSSKQNVTAQSSNKSIDAQSAQSIKESIDAQSAQPIKESIDAQSLKQNVTAQSSKKSINAQSAQSIKESIDAQSLKQNVTAQSSKKSINAQSAQSIKESIDAQSLKQNVTAQSSKKSIDPQSSKQNLTSQSPKESVAARSSNQNIVSLSPKQSIAMTSPKQNVTAQSSKENVVAQSPKENMTAKSSKQNVATKSSKQSIVSLSPKQSVAMTSSTQSVPPQSPKQTVATKPSKQSFVSLSPQQSFVSLSPQQSIVPLSLSPRHSIVAHSPKQNIDNVVEKYNVGSPETNQDGGSREPNEITGSGMVSTGKSFGTPRKTMISQISRQNSDNLIAKQRSDLVLGQNADGAISGQNAGIAVSNQFRVSSVPAQNLDSVVPGQSAGSSIPRLSENRNKAVQIISEERQAGNSPRSNADNGFRHQRPPDENINPTFPEIRTRTSDKTFYDVIQNVWNDTKPQSILGSKDGQSKKRSSFLESDENFSIVYDGKGPNVSEHLPGSSQTTGPDLETALRVLSSYERSELLNTVQERKANNGGIDPTGPPSSLFLQGLQVTQGATVGGRSGPGSGVIPQRSSLLHNCSPPNDLLWFDEGSPGKGGSPTWRNSEIKESKTGQNGSPSWNTAKVSDALRGSSLTAAVLSEISQISGSPRSNLKSEAPLKLFISPEVATRHTRHVTSPGPPERPPRGTYKQSSFESSPNLISCHSILRPDLSPKGYFKSDKSRVTRGERRFSGSRLSPRNIRFEQSTDVMSHVSTPAPYDPWPPRKNSHELSSASYQNLASQTEDPRVQIVRERSCQTDTGSHLKHHRVNVVSSPEFAKANREERGNAPKADISDTTFGDSLMESEMHENLPAANRETMEESRGDRGYIPSQGNEEDFFEENRKKADGKRSEGRDNERKREGKRQSGRGNEEEQGSSEEDEGQIRKKSERSFKEEQRRSSTKNRQSRYLSVEERKKSERSNTDDRNTFDGMDQNERRESEETEIFASDRMTTERRDESRSRRSGNIYNERKQSSGSKNSERQKSRERKESEKGTLKKRYDFTRKNSGNRNKDARSKSEERKENKRRKYWKEKDGEQKESSKSSKSEEGSLEGEDGDTQSTSDDVYGSKQSSSSDSDTSEQNNYKPERAKNRKTGNGIKRHEQSRSRHKSESVNNGDKVHREGPTKPYAVKQGFSGIKQVSPRAQRNDLDHSSSASSKDLRRQRDIPNMSRSVSTPPESMHLPTSAREIVGVMGDYPGRYQSPSVPCVRPFFFPPSPITTPSLSKGCPGRHAFSTPTLGSNIQMFTPCPGRYPRLLARKTSLPNCKTSPPQCPERSTSPRRPPLCPIKALNSCFQRTVCPQVSRRILPGSFLQPHPTQCPPQCPVPYSSLYQSQSCQQVSPERRPSPMDLGNVYCSDEKIFAWPPMFFSTSPQGSNPDACFGTAQCPSPETGLQNTDVECEMTCTTPASTAVAPVNSVWPIHSSSHKIGCPTPSPRKHGCAKPVYQVTTEVFKPGYKARGGRTEFVRNYLLDSSSSASNGVNVFQTVRKSYLNKMKLIIGNKDSWTMRQAANDSKDEDEGIRVFLCSSQ